MIRAPDLPRAVLYGALWVAACAGPERIAPPASPAPSLGSPSDAIPGELDLALRVDLERIRGVLGESAFEALAKRGFGAGASGDVASERLLTDAMAHADSIWIALRPGARSELTDSVTILRGHFGSIDPRRYTATPPWQSAIDLGGGWRRYDRPAPPSRAAPVRIYARGDEMLVLVSTASLDSVERRLEQGADDPHVEPTEKGVLSLEARGEALRGALRERAPSAARFLERAKRLRVVADLDSIGLGAELELGVETESQAKETALAAAQVAKALAEQGGIAARVTRGLRIEAVGTRVVARLALPPETVAALLSCAGGERCD